MRACRCSDEKTKLQGDIRRLLARAKGIAAAAQKNTTTIQPRSWSPVGLCRRLRAISIPAPGASWLPHMTPRLLGAMLPLLRQ